MRKIILHLIKKISATPYTLHPTPYILYATRYSLLAVLFLASCAAPERKFPDIVWPPPPEEPRIKFVETLQSNLDVQEESSLANLFVGEEVREVLRKPYGVAVDKEGRVYVTDIGRVFIFDKKNKRVNFIGEDSGGGKLRIPIGIAVSQDGKVYVADTALDKVVVFDRDGKTLTTIGGKVELESPSGIAVDEKRGRLYIADAKKHYVLVYGLDGKLLRTIGKRGVTDGEFNNPTNIAIDRDGNLYVVDTHNFRVQVFDPAGKYIRKFGQLGDATGNFARPKGIALDSEDNIYIVDAAFQNYQIFTKEGQLLLFVGEGGNRFGQFLSPSGIAIDGNDMIYVVDQLNRRVQVFQYLSGKWKKKQAAQPK